ncbi:MAG: FecR family protein [Planctomycetota bacterium]
MSERDEPERDALDGAIRSALNGLLGDPADTWCGVMSRLPEPKRKPLWPLVASAVAMGLAAGWVIAALRCPTAQPATPPTPPPQSQPLALPVRVLAREGKASIESTTGPVALSVGQSLGFEQIVVTDVDSRLFLALGDQVEARLDAATRLILDGPRSATLARGRVFVRRSGGGGQFAIVTNEADIQLEEAEIQVTSIDGATTVVAFEGRAKIATVTGAEQPIAARQRLSIQDGMLGEVENSGPNWEHLQWQFGLLGSSPEHREEAYARAYELVRSLEDPNLARGAELALRAAGTVGAGACGMFAMNFPDASADVRKRAWLLLTDIGDVWSLPFLLNAITDADAEVRARAAAAIERITSIPSGQPPEFWREAPYSERFEVVRAWRIKLRNF